MGIGLNSVGQLLRHAALYICMVPCNKKANSLWLPLFISFWANITIVYDCANSVFHLCCVEWSLRNCPIWKQPILLVHLGLIQTEKTWWCFCTRLIYNYFSLMEHLNGASADTVKGQWFPIILKLKHKKVLRFVFCKSEEESE